MRIKQRAPEAMLVTPHNKADVADWTDGTWEYDPESGLQPDGQSYDRYTGRREPPLGWVYAEAGDVILRQGSRLFRLIRADEFKRSWMTVADVGSDDDDSFIGDLNQLVSDHMDEDGIKPSTLVDVLDKWGHLDLNLAIMFNHK